MQTCSKFVCWLTKAQMERDDNYFVQSSCEQNNLREKQSSTRVQHPCLSQG